MTLQEQLQHTINFKTKPLGALGKLEKIAFQIGTIQNTLNPCLQRPTIVVFAGDHGIAHEGVSAYPQEVTYQMVMNFLAGGAAINVFCRQHQIELKIVDTGVNYDFAPHPNLIDAKIAKQTQSFLHSPAMTTAELDLCLQKGKEIVENIHQKGSNVIGFGEMGIGNTSSASVLMSVLCNLPIPKCVGRGTGIDDKQLQHKIEILEKAKSKHAVNAPMEVLRTFGGFEIAQMCGAMLAAYENNMLILVDGFIASSAFLVSYSLNPEILKNALFCHLSDEWGHKNMLDFMGVEPLLNLQMRLGEGTGCAVAYPIIQSAVNFLNEMASFESAGVSSK